MNLLITKKEKDLILLAYDYNERNNDLEKGIIYKGLEKNVYVSYDDISENIKEKIESIDNESNIKLFFSDCVLIATCLNYFRENTYDLYQLIPKSLCLKVSLNEQINDIDNLNIYFNSFISNCINEVMQSFEPMIVNLKQ